MDCLENFCVSDNAPQLISQGDFINGGVGMRRMKSENNDAGKSDGRLRNVQRGSQLGGGHRFSIPTKFVKYPSDMRI